MSDRFDFLEIGDSRPASLPPTEPPPSNSLGWKPVRLRAVELIGEQKGSKAGEFSMPLGLAVDRWGALYVADSNNHRVQRIAPNGDVLVIGKPGNQAGQMWGPAGVAVDPSGQFLFVAEQGNNRVQCFRNPTGQYVRSIDGLRTPSGVAFDAAGMLWIADTGNARVLRVNVQSNEFMGTLDQSAGLSRPVAMATDAANNLYVTDGALHDVIRFSPQGTRLSSLRERRRLDRPGQVALDAQGRIYLAEAGANRLHVFDAEGNSLVTFDTPSTKLGPLRGPSGVAIGPNGEIYLADTLNHRVLRLAWE